MTVLLAVLALCGCAGESVVVPAETTPAGDRAATGDDVPRIERASHERRYLWLSYAAGGDTLHARVSLGPGRVLQSPSGDEGLPVRTLEIVPAVNHVSARAGREVAVHGTPAWRSLLDTTLDRLTPAEAGPGTVVDFLQEDELFLYRTGGGVPMAVPIIYKPPEIQVRRVYTFDELLAVMRTRLAEAYPRQRRLLFETGDGSRYGYPFVYADLASGKILFLRYMPDAGYSGALPLGTTLEVFTHTFIDHLRALFNQPVSSVSRLFTMVSATTADLARPTSLVLLGDEPPPPLWQGDGMDPVQWEAELDRVTGTVSSAGRLVYLVDGPAFFPRFIDRVGTAGKSVRLRVYIFDNDDYAVQVADLLKHRSAEIDVRVLVDGLGSRGAKLARSSSQPPGHAPEFSMLRYLEQDSAVRVRAAPNVWLAGDHTKTILIDDRLAFLGGMNIGREYRYDWHDMMVEVEGPVVGEISREFRRAWIAAGPLGDLRLAFHRDPQDGIPAGEADYPVRLLYTRPGDAQILRAQIAATRRARRHIFLENPYITSDAMLFELVKARRRGVDVRVIMPYRTDSGLIARSNVLAANAMIRNGIRVYIYPGMSHLKAAIYDGWACLGSANLDSLSLRTNREMNLATSHAPAVDALYAAVFAPDMQRSVELTTPLPSNWADHLAELLADYL